MEILRNVQRAENGFEKANFLSKYLYWYVNPIFSYGYNNVLDKTNIFKIRQNDSAEVLAEQLKRLWIDELQKYEHGREPSLLKALYKMVAYKLFGYGILYIILDACKISQVLFMKRLLDSLLYQDINSVEYIYWASCLAGAQFLIISIGNHAFFYAEVLGANCRSSCLSLVYQKVLRVSQAKLSSISTGHVVTLFSSDAQKIQDVCKMFNFIWIAPAVLVASIFILWFEFGPAGLAGIGVMMICIPLQAWMGKFFAYMRLMTVSKTDKRVNIMNEIISSMQVTKMYAWEESFSALINEARKLESSAIMKTSLVRAINNSLYVGATYIILFATFTMYFFYGDGINLSVTFFTLSMFFVIRGPVLLFFPMAVQTAMEGYVSCKRIQKFLLQEEMMPSEAEESKQKKKTNHAAMVKFCKVKASWNRETLDPVLNKVTFTANTKKSLVMIVGPVGSGKLATTSMKESFIRKKSRTSILMAAMKEMKILSGDVLVNGSVAYVSQESWVFGGTVRQNILFGKEYNRKAYNEVLKACDLQKDLDIFENGDLTLVGERGVSLSGGQKARINLARAVYHNADIYLLDDPLSAVDARVGNYLFERCIKGLLKNKIVILVTHQVKFLEHADDIVCLRENEEMFHGSLEDLSQHGVDIVAMLHPESTEKRWEHDSAIETEDNLYQGSNLMATRALSGISIHFSHDRKERQTSANTDITKSFESLDRLLLDDREENVAKGSIPYKVYIKYFSSGVGWLSSIFMIFSLIFGQICTSFTDYWLGKWALSESERKSNQTITSNIIFKENPDINLYIFAGLVLVTMFSNIFRAMYFFATLVRCSRQLHNTMFKSLLKAPMYFFDTNPVGQILNRFSGDIYMLDSELPWCYFDYAYFSVFMVAVIIINCISIPYLVGVVIPIIIAFGLLRSYYVRTSRQVKRLEAVSRSPLYTHISATLNGITTIRAFGLKDKIFSEFVTCLDYQVEAYLTYLLCSRWFGFRLDCLALVFQLFAFFAPVVATEFIEIDKALVAVGLTYLLMITGMFQWCMRQSAEVGNLMTSAERVFEYAEIEPESDDGDNEGLRPTWPEYGLITAEGTSFSYHTSLPYVLKKLYFCVRPKEKIGIVGRTGAGKSSLISMLLRLGQTTGTIRIDGYDISKLKLKDLRKSISVIPQDPVLFSGTLRKNLDPFVEYRDADIWEALEEVQLKDTVMELPNKLQAEITEAGSNLSVGERQLMCLARALLRNNRILLIDEATANVDHETDSVIQRTIREKFKDCTVLTIAHRLNTVMDSDRVMVIDNGKIVEFDEPYELLQVPSGHFRGLVNQAGQQEASRLEMQAEEAKQLRKLMLMQQQVSYPGSHITLSKSKTEIMKHFDSKVVYETTL